MSTPSKSPIKEPPLRLTGQSLTEERDRLGEDVRDNYDEPRYVALGILAGWSYH